MQTVNRIVSKGESKQLPCCFISFNDWIIGCSRCLRESDFADPRVEKSVSLNLRIWSICCCNSLNILSISRCNDRFCWRDMQMWLSWKCQSLKGKVFFFFFVDKSLSTTTRDPLLKLWPLFSKVWVVKVIRHISSPFVSSQSSNNYLFCESESL